MQETTKNPATENQIIQSLDSYRKGYVNRRELLRSLIAATGSYTAAHLFLESNGLAATLISEQESQSSNVTAETIRYRSGDVQIQAYLAKPKTTGKHPAVIVIHENRGLNEHIRDVARRFAAEGFLALAPDLLSRVGGTGKMKRVEEATYTINNLLPIYAVIGDLRAAFSYLEQHVDVDPGKISTVGFCWGGWRSFTLTTAVPKLYRAVVFYGSTPDSSLENIQAPILAHYAQWDHLITGNTVWTEKKMKQLGKKYQYYIYPDTDHAFFNDIGANYNPEAARLAWTRTLEFLRS